MRAVGAAHHQAHALALAGNARQLVRAMMGEGRRALLMRLGQRRPGLDAEAAGRGACLHLAALALGMDDAAPGRHQVDLAGLDGERRAQAVAMEHLALEQIGDGGEPDVRVRAHVDALADQELGRPHLVEEDEGPDHLLLRGRQGAPHLETAEIAGTRHDDVLDGVARARIAGYGIVGRLPAHALSTFSAGSICQLTPTRPACLASARSGARFRWSA